MSSLVSRHTLRQLREESDRRLETLAKFSEIAQECEKRVESLVATQQIPAELANKFELLWETNSVDSASLLNKYAGNASPRRVRHSANFTSRKALRSAA